MAPREIDELAWEDYLDAMDDEWVRRYGVDESNRTPRPRWRRFIREDQQSPDDFDDWDDPRD